MKSSLMSNKSLGGRGIALAVTLATLMLTAPREASAKGGTFHLWSAFGRAEAATITTPSHGQRQQEPLTLGGCGGKRYRDPNTHKCRGPADLETKTRPPDLLPRS
jgi:hypothetical protein